MSALPASPTIDGIQSPLEDYEQELQAYVSSLPFVEDLKANPDTETSRHIIKMIPEHQAVHLTHKSLSTPDTVPIPPIVFTSRSSGSMWIFYRLGAALCGHHNLVHGGFSATLLDEAMGVASFRFSGKRSCVTAQLNVAYKIPVPTRRCVLVKAEMVKVEGRKIWMKGSIEDPASETVFVTAEGLFIEPKQKVSQTDFQ